MSENLPFQGKSLQRSSDTECLELAETPQVEGTVPNKTVLAPGLTGPRAPDRLTPPSAQ